MSRPELFDAAVNKALTYALRLGLPLDNRDKLRAGLELWYLKTRFAYRIPLETVLEVLQHASSTNNPEDYSWRGGQNGQWTYKNPQDSSKSRPAEERSRD